ncbi:MAG: cysteine synthase family protein [Planctomycetes bacterium]|nr:cysteine synthase family protein [Planctomycetota bacterium]
MYRETSLLPSALDAIGSTPLVELCRLTKGLEGRIFAKLDYLNPGFSKKDRVARQIIEDAENNGDLASGQTVVELTSGNTGTGLAIVCGIKGYPFVAVMSQGNSSERARMMTALGAEVVLVDQLPHSTPGQVSGGDLELVEAKAQELVKKRKAFRADQFQLSGNFRAHYLYTGPEFIQQSQGVIQGFCDFVGSGGTFAGCAAALKEHDASIQCFVVEPQGAAVLAGKAVTQPNHRIQGGGYSTTELKFLNPHHMDGFIEVSDEEATTVARQLAQQEGIFAGFSSGANVCAAMKLLEGSLRGKVIATVINDSGLKYLSTDLWNT